MSMWAGSGSVSLRRDFDLRYLDRSLVENSRPYFEFVWRHAAARLTEPARVLEIGCATGAFVHFLLQRHPNLDITGVDALPELVERARRDVPRGRFAVGDLREFATLASPPFDVTLMLTLHSLFDDPEVWIRALAAVTRPGGQAFVFGLFNDYDVDVLVRVRYADSEGAWLPGWNVVSRKTVGLHLQSHCAEHRFHDYTPPVDNPEQPGDPLRSWTATMADGSRLLLNGAQIVHRFALLEIHFRDAERPPLAPDFKVQGGLKSAASGRNLPEASNRGRGSAPAP